MPRKTKLDTLIADNNLAMRGMTEQMSIVATKLEEVLECASKIAVHDDTLKRHDAQIQANTLTLYGDGEKQTGLVERSRFNRMWLSILTPCLGVVALLFGASHPTIVADWMNSQVK
jgi:hypothetical protein